MWAVLQPLTLIIIYSVIFSQVMAPGLPGYDQPYAYTVFLCSGLLLWTFFVELLTRSVGVFVQNGGLLKKVNFPRLTLPVIALLSALLNYLIIMALFMVLLFLTGFLPGQSILAAIPVVIITAGFAVGLGLLGATLNVYYRDVEQFTGVLTQFWFSTPIIYPTDIVPKDFHPVLVEPHLSARERNARCVFKGRVAKLGVDGLSGGCGRRRPRAGLGSTFGWAGT